MFSRKGVYPHRIRGQRRKSTEKLNFRRVHCYRELVSTAFFFRIKLKVNIRTVNSNDRDEWARMRNFLWNSSLEKHLAEIDLYFADRFPNIVNVLVL